MIKLIKYLKLYKEYKINIRNNEEYLLKEYGLQRNFFNELSTTLTLIDAPKDLIDKFGMNVLVKKNITEFFEKIDKDSEKLELQELISLYEVKQLNEFDYGITIGFKPLKSRRIFYGKVISIITLIILSTIGINIII